MAGRRDGGSLAPFGETPLIQAHRCWSGRAIRTQVAKTVRPWHDVIVTLRLEIMIVRGLQSPYVAAAQT